MKKYTVVIDLKDGGYLEKYTNDFSLAERIVKNAKLKNNFLAAQIISH